MSLYEPTVLQFSKMLNNFEVWLDAAAEHAKSKNFDVSVLLTSRLAPDQFHLIRQVQAACDQAKSTAARLAGQDPPKHADTEVTLDELKARIATVKSYLATFTPAHFEGAEARAISLPFLPGKVMTGVNFLHEMALPNFYFHATTAYAILRHNGVALGKQHFIGGLTLADA
ncbi:MAG: DUF1993 domain-containing protein [Deltaproteobacteria bacterium]|nr:DUF1993 domain-containing protein [Deltaproteobacteria bacterium]